MPLFTSLHRLLGWAPGPITDELINAAIESHLAETDDLDWKGELPPTKALNETDFPKDVAAMANSGGGVIVYGIEEGEKRATGRKDTGRLTERHESTLRNAAVAAITPPVFGLGIVEVGMEGNRVVAVVVPASSDSPHLIFQNHYFGAPVRNDADTVWMKERQIEASYRARLDERRHSAEALTNLYDEAVANWTSSDRAWLVAVAKPQLPSTASERPTRDAAREIFEEASKNTLLYSGSGGIHPIESVEFLNPRPGLRRWVAANNALSDSRKWRESWMAVHHDGSVTLGTGVGGQRSRTVQLEGHQIDSQSIETAVSDFMGLLRAASGRLGLGAYDVQVGINWPGSTPLHVQDVDSRGSHFDDNATPLARYTPVARSVQADAESLDFYWEVHDLAEDCVNQGGVPEVSMIRPPSRKTEG